MGITEKEHDGIYYVEKRNLFSGVGAATKIDLCKKVSSPFSELCDYAIIQKRVTNYNCDEGRYLFWRFVVCKSYIK